MVLRPGRFVIVVTSLNHEESNRMKVSILFDTLKSLDQRDRMIEAPPLARVQVPHRIESIGSNIIQTGERMLELRLDCIERVRAESFNETIAAAMPFSIKVYGIIECRWTNRGKKAWFQDIGYESVAGCNDCHLFIFGWKEANMLGRPNMFASFHPKMKRWQS